MHAYVYLSFAVAAEVLGTTALKLSDGMTRLVPALVVVLSYCIAFYLLSLALRTLPLGLVYAIWCALGIIGTRIIGMHYFNEPFTTSSLVATALIIVGIFIFFFERVGP